MSEENKEPETTETKAPKAPLEIIRGRMPVAVVFLVRFEHASEAAKDLAKQFGTTVGKINDIKNNANFSYVTDKFVPTQSQKDEAIAWLRRHPRYDADNVDKIVTEIDNLPLATAEQAAQYAEIAKSHRAQPVTTKSGEIANGGGGNRIKPKKTEEPKPEPTADELLA